MTATMKNITSPLKAFKRAPSLGLSVWENGKLITHLAEKKDTAGAFFLVEAVLAPGTEPPPHVHSREDELFYVLEGEFDVYVGDEAFKVEAGECVFLPKLKPHAFVVRSPRLRVLALFTPAGLEELFHGMSSPARRLDLPTGADTYLIGDLKQMAQRLSEYGARLLAPDEVVAQLPLYPKPLPPNPSKFPVSLRPEAIQWQPVFEGVEIAVLSGELDKAGSPYVIRAKHRDGAKVPPHWHSFDEPITVISGTWVMGLGEQFDLSAAQEFSAGSLLVVPKNVPHFATCKGETIVQGHGIGPFDSTFVRPEEDAV